MNVIALVPLDNRDGHDSGALTRVQGAPLLRHAVSGMLHSGCVDRVFVAGPVRHVPDYTAAVAPLADERVTVMPGGQDRAASARAALRAAQPARDDAVLVHDAARAFTRPETVRAVVDALRGGALAVAPVEPVTDTIKVVDAGNRIVGTRDRDHLRGMQSPQGFVVGTLGDADPACPLPDLGVEVHPVAGHPHGRRVATSFDLTVIEALLAEEEAP
ncbi:4-diphosphocytidyl-2-methyl-D-erythritol synthase [Saccharomonospora marina XMU15]|uniref:4-diphosphocytidyl-2-methyl-D-erythritol synthase n=1 Tax=Saccharomonospora marina XMU15 TaxID=882083 RepID=H5X143_9PSEU|nr:4-diphosphocytidyl-2-methyl-D-erythritol synthase [Saccharomonospora marina XMU15]